jgi:translation elongation factor P/translation initiation factor 5A
MDVKHALWYTGEMASKPVRVSDLRIGNVVILDEVLVRILRIRIGDLPPTKSDRTHVGITYQRISDNVCGETFYQPRTWVMLVSR